MNYIIYNKVTKEPYQQYMGNNPELVCARYSQSAYVVYNNEFPLNDLYVIDGTICQKQPYNITYTNNILANGTDEALISGIIPGSIVTITHKTTLQKVYAACFETSDTFVTNIPGEYILEVTYPGHYKFTGTIYAA